MITQARDQKQTGQGSRTWSRSPNKQGNKPFQKKKRGDGNCVLGPSWHGRFARINSRESFATETPIVIARQADLHESLGFPIRSNHPIRSNRANRFARITPLSVLLIGGRV